MPRIRTATRQRLIDLLKVTYADPAAVDVAYGPPRLGRLRVGIFVCNVMGERSMRTKGATRINYDDSFGIDVWFLVSRPGHDSGAEADQAVEDMADTLHEMLATNPTLALAGIPVPKLQRASFGSYEGPNPYPSDDGWASMGKVVVQCLAHITS